MWNYQSRGSAASFAAGINIVDTLFLSLKSFIFMRSWASHLFSESAFGGDGYQNQWFPKAFLSKILRKMVLPTSLKGNGVSWTPSVIYGDPDRAFSRVYTGSSGHQASSGAVCMGFWLMVVGRTKRLGRSLTCPELPQPLQHVFSPYVTQVGPSPSGWPRITFGRGLGQTAETAAGLAKSICRHESEP